MLQRNRRFLSPSRISVINCGKYKRWKQQVNLKTVLNLKTFRKKEKRFPKYVKNIGSCSDFFYSVSTSLFITCRFSSNKDQFRLQN